MKHTNINGVVLVNGIVWSAGCAAIAYACKVTKSSKPLLAMILIPRFSFTNRKDDGESYAGYSIRTLSESLKKRKKNDNIVEFDSDTNKEEE